MSNKPSPPFQTTPGGRSGGRVDGGTLNSDTSPSFEKPKSGRDAVKVINHLGGQPRHAPGIASTAARSRSSIARPTSWLLMGTAGSFEQRGEACLLEMLVASQGLGDALVLHDNKGKAASLDVVPGGLSHGWTGGNGLRHGGAGFRQGPCGFPPADAIFALLAIDLFPPGAANFPNPPIAKFTDLLFPNLGIWLNTTLEGLIVLGNEAALTQVFSRALHLLTFNVPTLYYKPEP